MKIMNAEISTCRLYKSEGWGWWDISLLFGGNPREICACGV